MKTKKTNALADQIKIHNEHSKSITKIDKYKNLNSTPTTEHKT